MKLTIEQKRQFIKAIVSGKANMKDFKTIPKRIFKRISPVTQDEISLTINGEPQVNILPDVLFKCQQDGKENSYNEIKQMERKVPFAYYSLADNPATEPAFIDGIEIMPTDKEELINYFLKQNY